jgi:hypothetical protein
MKILKIVVLFIIIFLQYNFFVIAKTECKYDTENPDIKGSLYNCMPEWSLENKTTGGWTELVWWLFNIWWSSNAWYSVNETKNKILNITQKIIITGSVLAIWWIVLAWILFIVWLWDKEKIKKARDALKWSIIWFIVMIVAQQSVNAIINFIYSL